jgi:hypothetical protein
MIVGFLERMGARIDWALNIPSSLGFFSLLLGIYLLAYTLFASRGVALLSVLFFLFNGSLGFIRFFTLHPLSLKTLKDIASAKDFPAFAPWGPGDVTAFWNLNIFTNQRHLAIAFAVVIAFILTTLRMEKRSSRAQALWGIAWGIGIGILPYFHQPTLLIMAVFMVCYGIFFPRVRLFLFITGLLAGILVIPQVMAVQGGAPSVVWHPGYIIHGDIIKLAFPQNVFRFLTFWTYNLGLHIILIPIGFFFLSWKAKRVLLPIVPLFLIASLFKFSVEVSANHKFFNFFMILGQMISAFVFVSLLKKAWSIKRVFISALTTYILLAVFTTTILTGVIDFFVVYNDTRGTLPDLTKNEAARWIAANTPKDAIFLNSNYLYHPASLAGRPIFLGWPYFAWSAGYKENRMPIMDTLYETRDSTVRCDILKKYHISYITVEDIKNDTNLPDIDLSYYLNTYTPVFLSKNHTYAIFTTAELCK